jgi:hypothetical protein
MMSFRPPNADILREMIAFAAEPLMEVEVGAPWIPDRCRTRGRFARRLAQRKQLSQPGLGDAAGTVELGTLKLRRLLFSELSRAAADQPSPCRYLRAIWVAAVAAISIIVSYKYIN